MRIIQLHASATLGKKIIINLFLKKENLIYSWCYFLQCPKNHNYLARRNMEIAKVDFNCRKSGFTVFSIHYSLRWAGTNWPNGPVSRPRPTRFFFREAHVLSGPAPCADQADPTRSNFRPGRAGRASR